MQYDMSRRSFVAAAGGGAAGLVIPGAAHGARAGAAPAAPGFPRQDPALVAEVVRVAHFDADAVRELVSGRPALARASWDWGFGDWETPLGAASHTGRREIADYLLAHGARPTVFTFAMLGDVDAVRAIVEGRPDVRGLTGPHGLSLMHHARVGGAEAGDVLAYLEEVGGADPQPVDLPLGAEERAAYVGTYRAADSEGTTFSIVERRERIAFRHAEEAPRDLLNQGDHVFHPVGSEAVRFLFEVEPGAPGPERGLVATAVAIRDGDAVLSAERVG